MFFLLRMAFWLTLILALVPMFARHDEASTQTAATKLNAGDAISAATATVSDLSQFCSRRPEACAVGAEAIAAVGASAQTGVKILLEYLQEKSTTAESASSGTTTRKATAERAVIGKAATRTTGSISGASRDTLTPADLAPPWQKPRPDEAAGADRPA